MRRIVLRAPCLADGDEFVTKARTSRALHGAWTHAPETRDQFAAYVERMSLPAHRGFFVCGAAREGIVGVVNITNIVMGNFCSGYLGYYVFAGFERAGYMRAGLSQVIRVAFTRMKLHRLEANIQPDNRASTALVSACGFTREGVSPRYLKIAGRWRDHERWTIVKA